jgi:hypothetical protein
MAFVNDVAGFDLIDDLCVIIIQRTSAFVAFFNGGVKPGLFDMPLGDLKMLVNVHVCISCWIRSLFK